MIVEGARRDPGLVPESLNESRNVKVGIENVTENEIVKETENGIGIEIEDEVLVISFFF